MQLPEDLSRAMLQMTHVFPSKSGLARFAVDVSHGMQTRQQYSLFCFAATNIDPRNNRIKPSGDTGIAQIPNKRARQINTIFLIDYTTLSCKK